MPFLKITTNVDLGEDETRALAFKASKFVSQQLGKDEAFVQILLETGRMLIHGGADAPAATLELKSIGLAKERCAPLAAALCEFIDGELGAPPERVFIEFTSLSGAWFGWNGKTFA